MTKGLYYIVGGVQGGKIFKQLMADLVSLKNLKVPQILYIGAAHHNESWLAKGFRDGLHSLIPDASIHSLDLELTVDTSPTEISDAFHSADLIFFDGGSVLTLKRVFERFNLAEHCSDSVGRGNFVGGLCVGGAIFAEKIIYQSASKEVIQTEGAGLIKSCAVSCDINDMSSGGRRLQLLQSQVSSSFNRVGIGVNQMVVFAEDGTYCMADNDNQIPTAFTVTHDNGKLLLPCFKKNSL
jgi:cyanophycinase-like exopeptidase